MPSSFHALVSHTELLIFYNCCRFFRLFPQCDTIINQVWYWKPWKEPHFLFESQFLLRGVVCKCTSFCNASIITTNLLSRDSPPKCCLWFYPCINLCFNKTKRFNSFCTIECEKPVNTLCWMTRFLFNDFASLHPQIGVEFSIMGTTNEMNSYSVWS